MKLFGDSALDVVGQAGINSMVNAFCWPELLSPFLSYTVFSFFSFLLWNGLALLSLGLRTDGVYPLSPRHANPTFENYNNNNNANNDDNNNNNNVRCSYSIFYI